MKKVNSRWSDLHMFASFKKNLMLLFGAIFLSSMLHAQPLINKSWYFRMYAEPSTYVDFASGQARARNINLNPPDVTGFRVVKGLSGQGISFESLSNPGAYIRHSSYILYVNSNDGSELFKSDATFIKRPGKSNPAGASFESTNYPGYFITRSGDTYTITQLSSIADLNAATFLMVPCDGATSSNAGKQVANNTTQVNNTSGKTINASRVAAANMPFNIINEHATYYLVSRSTTRTLEIAGDPNANESKLVLANRKSTPNQQFRFIPLGNDNYYIQCVGSGKVLDVPGNSQESGVGIQQYDRFNVANQTFKVVRNDEGFWTITCAVTNMVLDVQGNANAEGTPIIQWPSHGGANQQFRLVRVYQGAPVNQNGSYYIVSRLSGKSIGVENNSSSNGARLIQKQTTGNSGEIFKFLPAGKGYFYILPQNGDKVIDVPGSDMNDLARMQLWDKLDGENQKFKLTPTEGGYYIIEAKHSGKVWDIEAGSREDGASVIQYGKHGAANQQFKFIPVGVPVVHFPGTTEVLTHDELVTKLNDTGFSFVTGTDALHENECAIYYANGDEQDLAGGFGILGCAVKYNDNLTVDLEAVYGSCDLIDAYHGQGAGSDCTVGVVKDNITISPGEGYPNIELQAYGPKASECTALSPEFSCVSMSAEAVGTSVGVVDSRGNGIGLGVGVGVGTAVGGGYKDGVLSVTLGLEVFAGGSISFSVNVEDMGNAIYNVADDGYVFIEGNLVAAGDAIDQVFTQDVGPAIIDAGNVVVGVVYDGANALVNTSTDLYNGLAADPETFFEDAGTTIIGTAEDIGTDISNFFDF